VYCVRTTATRRQPSVECRSPLPLPLRPACALRSGLSHVSAALLSPVSVVLPIAPPVRLEQVESNHGKAFHIDCSKLPPCVVVRRGFKGPSAVWLSPLPHQTPVESLLAIRSAAARICACACACVCRHWLAVDQPCLLVSIVRRSAQMQSTTAHAIMDMVWSAPPLTL